MIPEPGLIDNSQCQVPLALLTKLAAAAWALTGRLDEPGLPSGVRTTLGRRLQQVTHLLVQLMEMQNVETGRGGREHAAT